MRRSEAEQLLKNGAQIEVYHSVLKRIGKRMLSDTLWWSFYPKIENTHSFIHNGKRVLSFYSLKQQSK